MEQEVHLTFGVMLSVLAATICTIAWFIRGKMSSYDKYHRDHYEIERQLQTGEAKILQAVEDHNKHDDDRFARIEKGLDIISDDIKAILTRVSK